MESNINNNEKVLLCNHCKHINPLGTAVCSKCEFTVFSNTPIDISEAKAIQQEEIQRLIDEDNKNYETNKKKRSLLLKILVPIIAVWAVLTASMWMISTYLGPQDRTETVTINYEKYNENLAIGADAKLEATSAFTIATEYKTLNGAKVEGNVYYYVITVDGDIGVIKTTMVEAVQFIGYPSGRFFKTPVTYCGTIVEAPEEALLKYEQSHGKWDEDTINLKDALKENRILEVNFSQPTEREIKIIAEKTLSDKVFKVLLMMSPLMIILLIVLLAFKKPRKKYPHGISL